MTEERNKRKHWVGKRAATIAFGSSLNGAGNALYIYIMGLFIINIKYKPLCGFN